MAIGDIPPTKPAHGVIATRPATAPDAAPSVVACPLLAAARRRSQPSIAAAAATSVLMNACAASAVGAERRAGVEAEPAEPQDAGAEQRERQRVRRHRVLRPALPLAEHEDAARARPMPALMCTTVPPAKSSAPRSASQPAGANTQCATGA